MHPSVKGTDRSSIAPIWILQFFGILTWGSNETLTSRDVLSPTVSTAKPETKIDLNAVNERLIEIDKAIFKASNEHNEYLKELKVNNKIIRKNAKAKIGWRISS